MSNATFSSKFILLNSKSAGKDKIYRTVQYACKLIWYILWKTKSNKEYIKILKNVESSMSMTRKVLRFGKSHDMIESARKSIHIEDDFLRYVLTASSINQALYLVLDNALLLENFGFVKFKNSAKITEWSNKFWLASSIFALSRDLYDIINQIEANRMRLKQEDSNDINTRSAYNNSNRKQKSQMKSILKHLRLLFTTNPALMRDTTRDVFDVFLPLSFLKFVDISPGAQGAVGVVSSVLSVLSLWDSKSK